MERKSSYKTAEQHEARHKLQSLPVSRRIFLFPGLDYTRILTGARLAKRRCLVTPESGRTGCTRCERNKIPCDLFTRAVARPALGENVGCSSISPPADIGCGVAEATLLDAPWKAAAIQAYFDVVHGTHHSILHKPSFDARVAEGKHSPIILYAVWAIGIRFIPPDVLGDGITPLKAAETLAEKAHALLDLRETSVTTIQACVLLGTLSYAEGKYVAESTYYAVATRLALVLDLPTRPTASELEKQTLLRIWWSLYMIDVWSSAGMQVPRQLAYRDDVELPATESDFSGLSPLGPVLRPRPAPYGSLYGHMATLTRIWAEIQDLNQHTVEHLLPPMSVAPAVAAIVKKLQVWRDSLPSYLAESPANLAQVAEAGNGTVFCALHLGYHYYHEVLFYQYLADSHQRASPVAAAYATECSSHAKAFCDLLYLAERVPGCHVKFAMVGHMLVVTSTVYIHMLLFNTSQAIEATARKRLEQNFETLVGLQQYWPTISVSLARLHSFHQACLYSIENSFQVDRWMLRFILEHGSNVPEKFSTTELGLSPQQLAEFAESSTLPRHWPPRVIRA